MSNNSNPAPIAPMGVSMSASSQTGHAAHGASSADVRTSLWEVNLTRAGPCLGGSSMASPSTAALSALIKQERAILPDKSARLDWG